MIVVCGGSGEESAVVGEGGEGSASEGEPAGGPPTEAGGAAAEGRETPHPPGGEAETKTGKEQGQNLPAEVREQKSDVHEEECMN